MTPTNPQSPEQLISCPIVAIGTQNEDGTVCIEHVLCGNFPTITSSQMADLSFKLCHYDLYARHTQPPSVQPLTMFKQILCVKCGYPATFPSMVTEPFYCIQCQGEQKQPDNKAVDEIADDAMCRIEGMSHFVHTTREEVREIIKQSLLQHSANLRKELEIVTNDRNGVILANKNWRIENANIKLHNERLVEALKVGIDTIEHCNPALNCTTFLREMKEALSTTK